MIKARHNTTKASRNPIRVSPENVVPVSEKSIDMAVRIKSE